MATPVVRRRAFSAAARHSPALHLGTMTFGWNQASSVVDDSVAREMLQKFHATGGITVDAARIYSGGDSELIVGNALKDLGGDHWKITTKAHPSQPNGLSKAGIRSQLQASLQSMGIDRVETYYLHQPDTENDLVESLSCMHELVQEGLIKEIGVSNYSAGEVDRCAQICKDHGWVQPTVCQALYNPLNRWIEDELIPVLRKYSIGLVAYNPLAAGLLSGKHHKQADVASGRFKNNPNYLPRFYTDANFAALEGIRAACQKHNLSMIQAAYTWLIKHSKLGEDKKDAVLLGASSMAHLEDNIAACKVAEPLPDEVKAACDAAWEITRPGAFPFWRSYSRDHPDRENLPPGASYDAAKK